MSPFSAGESVVVTAANDLDDALDRLQAHLERLGAPIVQHLRPGVPADDAVARVRDATGLPLPDQAARWFAWHDGVAPHDPFLAPHLLGTWELLGLDAAIDDYQQWLRLAGKAEPPNPHPTVEAWDTRWFPLARDSSGRPLMVVCGGERDGQVDLIEYEDPDLILHSYPSIAWVVEFWVGLLDTGVWYYDEALGRLAVDRAKLTGELREGPY